MKFLIFFLLVSWKVCHHQSSLISHERTEVELGQYQVRVNEAYQSLLEECPDMLRIANREIMEGIPATALSMETRVYQMLAEKLAECRNKPATPQTTTLPALLAPIPDECKTAINLTESWRKDRNGTQIKPINNGYSCDTGPMVNNGRPWFRFTGAAGTRLLDTCPMLFSCGTFAPLWSISPMPADVGVQTPITVYGSRRPFYECNYYNLKAVVLRCSTKTNDFVYKYSDPETACAFGFCGMD